MGVTEKLTGGARVADVGCGHGHSTVLMAKAYPASRFWGFDVHQGSIAAARQVAQDAGVDDRVAFEVLKADNYPQNDYDLICFFDCLHDMGRPIDAARHAAGAMADDGTLMLVEPFAGDRVNINPIGRLYYAAIDHAVLCPCHLGEGHPRPRRSGRTTAARRGVAIGGARFRALGSPNALQFDHRGASIMTRHSEAKGAFLSAAAGRD
jgi:SAM-dependent methyltransferase